jgi:hypothetical protein
MRGVMDEGPTNDRQTVQLAPVQECSMVLLCGSIASHMHGVIDDPRRRAKRNNFFLPDTKMPLMAS